MLTKLRTRYNFHTVGREHLVRRTGAIARPSSWWLQLPWSRANQHEQCRESTTPAPRHPAEPKTARDFKKDCHLSAS